MTIPGKNRNITMPSDRRQPANINSVWAEVMVRELVRLGVGRFYLSPGSRSSPLALAVAEHGGNFAVHPDERGAGFAALGYARGSGRPAVVVTTSGSAVANLAPATCEAALDGVPLLLLTADRPPELRDVGANQTMDQLALFGGLLRWRVDLPCPDRAIPVAFLLTSLDYAVFRATCGHPGPVHLNQMLREPLAPTVTDDGAAAWSASAGRWWRHRHPWTTYFQEPTAGMPDELARRLAGVQRGLIIAGTAAVSTETKAMLAVAETLGWPVLPDIRSGLRLRRSHPQLIQMADQILLAEQLHHRLRPDLILHLGGRLTSKRLQQFIAMANTEVVQVNPLPVRIDPDHLVSCRVVGDIGRTFACLTATTAASDPVWLAGWKKLDRVAGHCWRREQAKLGRLTEPGIAGALSALLPRRQGLVLAASMAVRDMEMYGASGLGAVPLAANRGVSGIDGNLATAVGFAAGLGQGVTLLIGDLALLHDLNSLALLRTSANPVVVVVINNDGGGIFSFLPIAEIPRHFESCFATPHGLHFAAAAAMFALPYARPASLEELSTVYRQRLTARESAVIELVTDRHDNVLLHRSIQEALRRVLSDVDF
jgi:2-succinyl-5-enolpyruvyl-6-hydroxy-3-cyclohexene-1-carboxylate synthase